MGISIFEWPVNAQSSYDVAQLFKSRNHIYLEDTLPYRVLFPVNYDPYQSYPIILCLHGAGERGLSDLKPITRHNLVTSWAVYSNQIANPCFVVVPQCDIDEKWNNVNFRQGSYNIDTLEISNKMKTVVDLLDKLITELNIDPNRQYVTGLSMGGYGTWDIITRYPNRFAAAIPMSGAGDPTKVEQIMEVPIWAFHNSHDHIVPVEGSRSMISSLKNQNVSVLETKNLTSKKIQKALKQNPKHLYTECDQGLHGPWELWYEDSKLHQWLFSQKKGN